MTSNLVSIALGAILGYSLTEKKDPDVIDTCGKKDLKIDLLNNELEDIKNIKPVESQIEILQKKLEICEERAKFNRKDLPLEYINALKTFGKDNNFSVLANLEIDNIYENFTNPEKNRVYIECIKAYIFTFFGSTYEENINIKFANEEEIVNSNPQTFLKELYMLYSEL
jgi:hypothetical protein